MSDMLGICRRYIADLYRRKLGYELSESLQNIGPTHPVVWRTVSANDLTSPVDAKGETAAGLVMDYEIGIVLYILPYHESTDINRQITRALGLRSRLLSETNYTGAKTDQTDEHGDWRIVLHWLVDKRIHQNGWIESIIELRRQTAFTEEIPLDAIFIDADGLERALDQHKLPRLMFTIREVLKKKHLTDIEQWLNVDDLVASALETFPGSFRKLEHLQIAQEIAKQAASYRDNAADSTDEKAPASPRTLKSIRVQNFRNIDDLSLDFGSGDVESRVLHGPNGTGKSAVFEALSLALFQSSYRYSRFVDKDNEKDITVRDRARHYLECYLTPVARPTGMPGIDLNEEGLRMPVIVEDEDGAKAADVRMDGSLLSQETSQEFLRMQASELGARVLKGYSGLAEHLFDYADRNLSGADEARKRFLNSLNLNASITRIETAKQRIVQEAAKTQLPSLSLSLVQWLERAAETQREAASPLGQLAAEWRTWSNEVDNPEAGLPAELAELNHALEIAVPLERWLTQFNALNARTREAFARITSGLGTWQEDVDKMCEQLNRWGDWLSTQASQPVSGSPVPRSRQELEPLRRELSELQARQKGIVDRGTEAKGRLEHFSRIDSFIRQEWVKKHPNECPTCGTDHSTHGGILQVIHALQEAANAERERLWVEYNAVTERVRQVQANLTALGEAKCPVSAEEQALLAQKLRSFLPESSTLQNYIADNSQKASLVEALRSLRHVPSLRSDVEAESEAKRVAQEIVRQFANASTTLEGPMNWKPVRDELRTRLTNIVNQHLPSTLQQLWTEFVLNLTSARWLLPGPMKFDVKSKRADQKLSVVLEAGKNPLLARHILNLAEIHILGLAWFFTRYVTHGRFYCACLIMDDPAQELDQTSYRDLCRLWETLIRLHKVYSLPLKLVAMLHQESRALEAARATGGVLYVLGWVLDQKHSLKKIALLGEGFHSPQPDTLFKAVANA